MKRLAIMGGTPVRSRPFPHWPIFDKDEERAVIDVLRSGNCWWHSFGEATQSDSNLSSKSQVTTFQRRFAKMQGGKYGIACANGTGAIEIALRALGVGPGDEIIVPAYTFVATASAVLMVNAVPIFVDIDYETFNIAPTRIEQAVTRRTKGIIPVHFAGQAADMERILAIARQHGLVVVEDAAHAHGGMWKDKGLGAIGAAGTFSFQASKNMTAGEGGLILTGDEHIAELCESYIWNGRQLGRPWYEHHRLGWNYRMTELQGAILLQQLRRLESQNQKRRQNATYLARHLAEIPGLHPLIVPKYVSNHPFHIFVIRFAENEFGVSRNIFLSAMQAEGIPCSAGYAHGLYRNPMFLTQDFHSRVYPLSCGHLERGIDYASFQDACPNVERACREAIWLEHSQLLGEEDDMQDIIRAANKIYDCREELCHGALHFRSPNKNQPRAL